MCEYLEIFFKSGLHSGDGSGLLESPDALATLDFSAVHNIVHWTGWTGES